jgi:PHD/YefM family antitoxin component YafN of YafNO toxin-antitoxin module
MSNLAVLLKEKIVSLSQLQKNPSQALNAPIVKIVKNGKEIGVFLSKQEFEDLLEENLTLKKSFKAKLDKLVEKSKKEKLTPLEDIL